jgi:hypothetical protein
MSETNKNTAQEKISAAAGGAVAAYVVAKALHDSHKQRKAKRVAKDEAEAAATAPTPQPEKPVEPSPEEKAEFGNEKSKLASLRTYIGQHINAPSSIRKILPRNGLYHSPWAYHNRPSYASLKLDQSEYNTSGEYKYNSGMGQLVAAGKKPLGDALSASRKQHPDSPWGTILSGNDLLPSNNRVTDASSARGEKERILGLWSAVEGMGFDSGDMGFARWQDKEGSHYTVVPYDVDNDLHHVAAGNLGTGIDLAQEPGFMLRVQGTRPVDLSVSVSVVDMDTLRTQMGAETIPHTPNPAELTRREYRGPGVLPSTQPGGF